MRRTVEASDEAAVHLLPLLQAVAHARKMSLADWDSTLRLARQARVLGVLAHRLRNHDEVWAALPQPVTGHLRGSINYAAHRAQMVRMELAALDAALPPDVTVTMLKGAAYQLQGVPIAQGRNPNDVDLLVRREDLDRTEAALSAAGWVSEVKDDYDQRYYREWSHELPPMRYPGHALEVDLHHTIAPVTSRTRADDALLFGGLVALPDSRYRVLDPCDQIIHAAVHLFQDSELDGRLRDLVDVDGLIRFHVRDDATWRRLLERARAHRADRVLWYALHYCRKWLATPVPGAILQAAPSAPAQHAMEWVFSRSGLPHLPDRPQGLGLRTAFMLGRMRYHLLRMPPGLLVRHLVHKAWTRRFASRSDSPR
ncbi:nucleotidyltransferase domain-containing protein [Rhodocyclaceae bacterium SMB388]